MLCVEDSAKRSRKSQLEARDGVDGALPAIFTLVGLVGRKKILESIICVKVLTALFLETVCL